MVKAIRIEVGSIKAFEGNWRLTNQYELDGNLKSTKANGSRSQTTKHEFKSWTELRCKTRIVWNAKHGYSFGTKKFVNKRMTHMTLRVFNWNWIKKRSLGVREHALGTKGDL